MGGTEDDGGQRLRSDGTEGWEGGVGLVLETPEETKDMG